jgi:hypothetical protein
VIVRVLADRVEQLVQIERLLDESRCVHAGHATERRQHDHRDIGQLGIALLRCAELPAVHAGHHEVEEHDVRVHGPRLAKRLGSVTGPVHHVALVREHLRHGLTDVALVVDH